MSYQIEPDEPIPTGVRRVVREEAERIVEGLEEPGADAGNAIHDARKRLKKIRAVLRLVRIHVGEDLFDRENVAYRDAGRLLAGAREADVAVETVDALKEAFDEAVPEEAFRRLRGRLEGRARAAVGDAMRPGGPAEEVRYRVSEAVGRIPRWPLAGLGFQGVVPGVRKVYERGRNRMADAYGAGTSEAFHEWRKRVKYLWYHLRLLTPTWPALFEPLADAQHDLADLLGDANDLTDLLRLLDRPGGVAPEDEAVAEAVRRVARRRRASLWERARPLGHRIYAEEPEDFVERMERYREGMRMEERAR